MNNTHIVGIPEHTDIISNVLEANNACIERQRQLIKMLGRCRQQFLLYAESHRAKQTEEGNQKAETNEGLAKDIEDLLHVRDNNNPLPRGEP